MDRELYKVFGLKNILPLLLSWDVVSILERDTQTYKNDNIDLTTGCNNILVLLLNKDKIWFIRAYYSDVKRVNIGPSTGQRTPQNSLDSRLNNILLLLLART